MADQTPKISSASFTANGRATLIGSLPVTDHDEALKLIFKYTPDVPLWPQLPVNPQEGMLSQFIEGLPGVIEEENKLYFDISGEAFPEQLLAFFEDYLAVSEGSDLLASRFNVSDHRAAGIYRLVATVADNTDIAALKGQITGPFTLLTGIHDQENRLGYYDPTIREMAVKGLAMKAAWQTRFLASTGRPVLVFIDEPALAGLGSSSFISVGKDDIAQDLNEVAEAIHQEGGLAGVHVCANTDWNLLLNINIDILSFDAYGFFDRLITCKDLVHQFLAKGGIIAWGIVPTSEEEHIRKESAQSLAALWEKQAAQLAGPDWDLPKILRQTLITPSCGTGSLSLELAERVLTITSGVSKLLRDKYPV